LNAVLDDLDEFAKMLENVDMDSGVRGCVCVGSSHSRHNLDLCLSGLNQQPPSTPTEKKASRSTTSLEELLSDNCGQRQFAWNDLIWSHFLRILFTEPTHLSALAEGLARPPKVHAASSQRYRIPQAT
jgi:hypothetical protein